MSLKDRLQTDLATAMKAREDATVGALRLALSAISAAEVAGDERVSLADDAVLRILAAEVKKKHEAHEAFAGAGRTERAEREAAEAIVLEAYLPAALSDDDLGAVVAEEVAAAAASGATGPKAMGAVIKAVRARVGASVDGARIAAAVKAALA